MLRCGVDLTLQTIFFIMTAAMINTSNPAPADAPITTYFWLVCGAAVASSSEVNGDVVPGRVVLRFRVLSVPEERFQLKIVISLLNTFSERSAQIQPIMQVEIQ